MISFEGGRRRRRRGKRRRKGPPKQKDRYKALTASEKPGSRIRTLRT
jgi:hypothetical protein